MKLTLVFCFVLGLGYILILRLFATVAGPNGGNAEVVELNGKVVGVANIAQQFTDSIYFWGRPSAADWQGDASCGSNYGPSNPDHLTEVEARINEFLAQHPYLERSDIPADMITASGSGLDPHISPVGALIQVERVALARGVHKDTVRVIVEEMIEEPTLSIWGTAKVNVLKLNVALEERLAK